MIIDHLLQKFIFIIIKMFNKKAREKEKRFTSYKNKANVTN